MEQFDRRVGLVHHRVVDFLADRNGAHRDDRVGQALRRRDDVRQHAEPFRRRGITQATEAGDDLIEDQQDAVLVADFAQTLQIALRRHQNARRPGHRFHHDGGDGRRVVQRHQTLQIIGEMRAVFRLALREGIVFHIMRMADVVHAGQQRAEIHPVLDDPADGNTAEADTVIAAFATDQAGPCALAPCALIGQRDLQRRIAGFGPGIGKEDMIQIAGEHVAQTAGQFEGLVMAELEGRCEVQFLYLFLHRFHDLRFGMPGIDAPQARRPVQDIAVIMAFVIHAFRRHEDARILLETAIGRERHPEGAEVVLRDSLGHGGLPCG